MFFFYQALELKETEPKMKQGIEYFGKLALNWIAVCLSFPSSQNQIQARII